MNRFFFFFLLFYLLPSLVFAQTTTTPQDYATPVLSVDIPTISFSKILEQGSYIKINSLGEYLSGIYTYSISIAITIAIIILMVGGIQYILASTTGETQKAKERIFQVIKGLILLFCLFPILFLVNPKFVFFDALVIKHIPVIHLKNETGNTLDDYDWVFTQSVGNNGVGWNNVPMFDQKAYQGTPYGICGTVKTSGCGVTSFAMVATYFSGSSVPPDAVASIFANEGFRACPANATPEPDGTCPGCNGTYAAAFYHSSLMNRLGLTGRELEATKRGIENAFRAGELVIISYKTKSGGGHYVVLVGTDVDGNVLVNNPWGGVKEKRTWDQIESTIKSATAIKKRS